MMNPIFVNNFDRAPLWCMQDTRLLCKRILNKYIGKETTVHQCGINGHLRAFVSFHYAFYSKKGKRFFKKNESWTIRVPAGCMRVLFQQGREILSQRTLWVKEGTTKDRMTFCYYLAGVPRWWVVWRLMLCKRNFSFTVEGISGNPPVGRAEKIALMAYKVYFFLQKRFPSPTICQCN